VSLRHPAPEARATVPRPHLFDRLDAGTRGPLTLITGPAGAGKTQLLSAWLAARPPAGPVAWLSVEPTDRRPGRFWDEVLRLIATAAGRELAPVHGRVDVVNDDFLASLTDAVDELDVAVTLVLDDFEQLHSRLVTEGLDRFLRFPQQRLRLVIASRTDPGLSLQRLRLDRRLTELRSADLALSQHEARQLFEMSGLALDDDHIAKLHERTEGWVGGLSLAALSLRGHPDPDGFVRSFTGDERTVADYLIEEVLHQQPSAIRDFMLRTSVVDELEPELADALTGRDDGIRALEVLERSNAFLVAVDHQRRRYRYHPMFKELLRSQLRYRMPDAHALQHRRAARWFAANGPASTAVRHAVAAGDVTVAAKLVSEHWLALLVHREAAELSGWVDGLTPRLLAGSAELALAGAGAALALGQLEQAQSYIELADANAGGVPAKRRARFALSRAIVTMLDARVRGDYEATRSAAHKVLGSLQVAAVPGDSRVIAHLNLAIAEHWTEESDGGVARLEEALELARRHSCEYVVLDCLGQLALFKVLDGALHEAARFGDAALELARRNGWDEDNVAAPAFLALGIAHVNWAAFDDAGHCLAAASRAVGSSQSRTTTSLIALFQALVDGRTDIAAAARAAHSVRNDIDEWGLPSSLAVTAGFFEAVLLAEAGQSDRSRQALERGDVASAAPVETAVVEARLALARSDAAEALQTLEAALSRPSGTQHAAVGIEALGLAAVCRHLLHDEDGALALVEEALDRAQPEGLRYPLLAVGLPLPELLRRRIRAGTQQRTLAGEIIALIEDQGAESHEDPRRVLLDPLSDREEVVLRYLPTVMSKAEIASELFVSINTVKTHTKNIYRKLGVGTRTEAVRRARHLNLV
jgi:LuxR family transcriptional regulator, maltose regulon positive regulatory protein